MAGWVMFLEGGIGGDVPAALRVSLQIEYSEQGRYLKTWLAVKNKAHSHREESK